MEENTPRPDLSALRISKEKRFDDRPRSKAWTWIGLVLLLAAIIVGYFIFKESVTPGTQVKVGTASMISGSDAAASLVATGYVVAQRKAEVASKGTGRLVRLDFEEGDVVKSGEVIAILDNEDIRANLQVAKAQLEQAKVDSLNAGRTYRRYTGLKESGAVTTAEVETAESNYMAALAAVAGAEASVTTASVNLENTYIRAPFAGTILTKNAEVGEIVAPFASSASSKGSVVTLADMNSLEVEADVSESNINRVQVGQPAEIILDAYPTVRYAAKVKKIVPTADRSRATVLTKVTFTQIDDKVLPEMSARVNFFLDTAAAASTTARILAVPKDAITDRDGQSVVFRIDGELVTMVPVETGRELGRMVEVISGLANGDRVVLTPPGKMSSGQKIEISS
ncbi:MAG: efflux RND transporter periplasmic adaptor subunit [bacterium]|nr:efflux RND transporter periplasmic adaptor subunit [bacterium]